MPVSGVVVAVLVGVPVPTVPIRSVGVVPEADAT